MYQWLCGHFPPPVVNLGYMVGRALLIVLVVMCSDATLSAFQYANF